MTDVVDTLPRSGLVGGCLESVFFADEHSYNLSATTVNLGIDREGTAKSQDGQQKRTLAHVLFKNIDIHVHCSNFSRRGLP